MKRDLHPLVFVFACWMFLRVAGLEVFVAAWVGGGWLAALVYALADRPYAPVLLRSTRSLPFWRWFGAEALIMTLSALSGPFEVYAVSRRLRRHWGRHGGIR